MMKTSATVTAGFQRGSIRNMTAITISKNPRIKFPDKRRDLLPK